jgi:hypothetical protein
MLCACSEELDSETAELDGLAAVVAQSLEARGLPTDSVSVIEQIVGGGATRSSSSLCELAWSYNGAVGLYRVEELVSARETAEQLGDVFTYAALVGETLTGEQSELVVRVAGGTLTDGSGQTGLISLETGQELVMFTSVPTTDVNQGFPLAFEWTTFAIDPDGAVGNAEERWENLDALAEAYVQELANPPLESTTRDTSDPVLDAQLAEACEARR